MIDPLLHTWHLNLGYAKRLVADIPDATLALQPAPGRNHAAGCPGTSPARPQGISRRVRRYPGESLPTHASPRHAARVGKSAPRFRW
jgi:hypothetical protein